MTPVFLESPYAPPVPKNHPEFARLLARNLAYARAAIKDCLGRGESAYASHLLFTQDGVLDDTVLEERVLGINAGRVWAQFAEKVVVYVDLGISPGMVMGITRARAVGQPVEERSLPKWKQPAPTQHLEQPESGTGPRLELIKPTALLDINPTEEPEPRPRPQLVKPIKTNA